MHLRRLIVLITYIRNIIGRSRSCTLKNLRRRIGFLAPNFVWCRIEPKSDACQKKNQKSRRSSIPPRGCRVKRDRKRSLYDVKISGQGTLSHSHKPNFALFPHVICTKEPAITEHDQTKEWWSLTGSNRRHPACKAGALPAELRPHFLCDRAIHAGGRIGWPGQTRTADLTLIRRAL